MSKLGSKYVTSKFSAYGALLVLDVYEERVYRGKATLTSCPTSHCCSPAEFITLFFCLLQVSSMCASHFGGLVVMEYSCKDHLVGHSLETRLGRKSQADLSVVDRQR